MGQHYILLYHTGSVFPHNQALCRPFANHILCPDMLQVRKGMVLVDERLHPVASWEFDADIAILTHSTTIQPRYQAVIHCEIIRQAARVVAMDKERLRSGDRACVRFRFLQRPEYVTPGTRFVFREGRTKGIGIVVGDNDEEEGATKDKENVAVDKQTGAPMTPAAGAAPVQKA